jgi:2-C-methyl-D-erythritol 4-phosphate cytidylyltransferase
MLLRSIRPFARHPRVRQIVVALPAGFADRPPEWLGTVAGERLRLVPGGATRAESVGAALAAVSPECAVLLVHDAARPFVSPETVDAVVAVAARGTGALPAVAVADTLKRTGSGSTRVVETVDRSDLWRAQTPQGFPRTMLVQAFARVAPEDMPSFTDEASLVEAAGFPVEIVPGDDRNIKVTTAEDFELAEFLADR